LWPTVSKRWLEALQAIAPGDRVVLPHPRAGDCVGDAQTPTPGSSG
jgi:hypothetical protein